MAFKKHTLLTNIWAQKRIQNEKCLLLFKIGDDNNSYVYHTDSMDSNNALCQGKYPQTKHNEQKFSWREPEFMSNYSVILFTSTKSH